MATTTHKSDFLKSQQLATLAKFSKPQAPAEKLKLNLLNIQYSLLTGEGAK